MVKIPKIKLDQSINKRLKEKHGKDKANIISECMEECMEAGKEGDELKSCIQECLKRKLGDEEAAKIDVDSIYGLMGHWATVG